MSAPALTSAAKAAICAAIQEGPGHLEKTEAIILADMAPRVIPSINLPFWSRGTNARH